MRRIVLALAVAALASLSLATPAAACPTCFDPQVSLQTPDGRPWSDGKPVTVVVSAQRPQTVALPPTGLVVVMRTDGDRTKCLEVPLKLVRSDGAGATYAGIFYPFRAAAYDGKLRLGDETSDISFDVRRLAATAPVAPQADLPAGTTCSTARTPARAFARSTSRAAPSRRRGSSRTPNPRRRASVTARSRSIARPARSSRCSARVRSRRSRSLTGPRCTRCAAFSAIFAAATGSSPRAGASPWPASARAVSW